MTLLRRNFLAVITGSLLSLIGGGAQAATGPLIKPTRLGQTVIFRNKLYTCIKKGKNLVWNQGVPIKGYTKPTPTPAASASASASAAVAVPVFVAKLSDIADGQVQVVEVKPAGATKFSVAVSRKGSTYEVFSASCTHQGCTVEAVKSDLACPCHGSAFNGFTGAVINGPAERALKKYVTVQDSGSLFIKA